ncbi:MAG: hypothetical protein ACTS4U_01650 [Candidatus Hodgkinia cicadicola]
MMDICVNINLRLSLNESDLSKILNKVQVLHLQDQSWLKNRPEAFRLCKLK